VATYISSKEIKNVDITYGSAKRKGVHLSGASRLSGNKDILAQILKENLGVSSMRFFEGNLSMEGKLLGGMGFERQSS
jgi:hypothetical protein